jgi:hypothetical protein
VTQPRWGTSCVLEQPYRSSAARTSVLAVGRGHLSRISAANCPGTHSASFSLSTSENRGHRRPSKALDEWGEGVRSTGWRVDHDAPVGSWRRPPRAGTLERAGLRRRATRITGVRPGRPHETCRGRPSIGRGPAHAAPASRAGCGVASSAWFSSSSTRPPPGRPGTRGPMPSARPRKLMADHDHVRWFGSALSVKPGCCDARVAPTERVARPFYGAPRDPADNWPRRRTTANSNEGMTS